jgi:hypothetical protein
METSQRQVNMASCTWLSPHWMDELKCNLQANEQLLHLRIDISVGLSSFKELCGA